MGQWTNLATARGQMRMYSCDPYQPYRINGEKNPKFDRHSGYILSSKSSQERNFSQAIRYFSDLLTDEVPKWRLQGLLPAGTDLRMLDGRPFADVILVPSSKVGKVSDGLVQIMERVCARDKRLAIHTNALVRLREIAKLAAGGSRNISVHQQSIAFRPRREVADLIVLVDDVCTTGNSLVACCDIIQNHRPNANVISIVLGKTAHD